MTTTNCPHCNRPFVLEGICESGHVHRIEPGIFCMCTSCGLLITLSPDGLTFREVGADEMHEIPDALLIWATRLHAQIQARKIVNRARAAAVNN